MGDHDHSYKMLFSHAALVRDLLSGFVQEDWIKDLDLDTLEKVASTFVADDLREREDDTIWRVRCRDNQGTSEQVYYASGLQACS